MERRETERIRIENGRETWRKEEEECDRMCGVDHNSDAFFFDDVSSRQTGPWRIALASDLPHKWRHHYGWKKLLT